MAMRTRLVSSASLGSSVILLTFAFAFLCQSVLASLDYIADYRLDNTTVSACFNSTLSACACMNTRPAPLGSPDRRRIITDLECWDCQSKMCMQRTCRRTFTVPYCDLYVGCVRLCLCRCPGTRYGRTGRSFVYIPCNQWCDGKPDCPYGLDEPKGVYCAKRNYWFTIMPLSTIGLVVLFLFTCRQSIAKTLNSLTRHSVRHNHMGVPRGRFCDGDRESLTARHTSGMPLEPLRRESLQEYPSYDQPPPEPCPSDPNDNLPPPPSYESVIANDTELGDPRRHKP